MVPVALTRFMGAAPSALGLVWSEPSTGASGVSPAGIAVAVAAFVWLQAFSCSM